MKFNNLCIRKLLLILPLLVLVNSCTFYEFPLTINDIDTLSVYKNYQDSLRRNTFNNAEKIIETSLSSSQIQNTATVLKERWTICTGVFRLKQNAKRNFYKLNTKTGAFLIIRGKFHFITTGIFDSRDSAWNFKKAKISSESYLLKIAPKELLIQAFPE